MNRLRSLPLWQQPLMAACAFVLLPAAPMFAQSPATADYQASNEHYEVRTYHLGEKGDAAALDEYLKNALIPALNRQSDDPVGVFAPAENDENDCNCVFVVIPQRSLDGMASKNRLISRDKEFLAAAETYHSRSPKQPVFERVSSELLVAMACMPELKVPEGTLQNPDRVYELRLYESATERLGDLKVDMFNNGEVPIFLDSGVIPVFIGQALIGPQTPNLTYLTVYPSEEARLKAWDAFRAHPDWQTLKSVKKYRGTVSRIDKYILKPKPYSQM
ncbi:MAG: NIPSNAP family protein [Planctomycetota bacterium]